jgi:hypothetical protein
MLNAVYNAKVSAGFANDDDKKKVQDVLIRFYILDRLKGMTMQAISNEISKLAVELGTDSATVLNYAGIKDDMEAIQFKGKFGQTVAGFSSTITKKIDNQYKAAKAQMDLTGKSDMAGLVVEINSAVAGGNWGKMSDSARAELLHIWSAKYGVDIGKICTIVSPLMEDDTKKQLGLDVQNKYIGIAQLITNMSQESYEILTSWFATSAYAGMSQDERERAIRQIILGELNVGAVINSQKANASALAQKKDITKAKTEELKPILLKALSESGVLNPETSADEVLKAMEGKTIARIDDIDEILKAIPATQREGVRREVKYQLAQTGYVGSNEAVQAMNNLRGYEALQRIIEPDNLTLKAQGLLREGKYGDVQKALESVKTRTPEQNNILAQAYYAIGEIEKAKALVLPQEQDVEQAIITSENINDFTLLAHYYLANGRVEEAGKLADKIAVCRAGDKDIKDIKTVIGQVKNAIKGIKNPSQRVQETLVRVIKQDSLRQTKEQENLQKLQEKAKTSKLAQARLAIKQAKQQGIAGLKETKIGKFFAKVPALSQMKQRIGNKWNMIIGPSAYYLASYSVGFGLAQIIGLSGVALSVGTFVLPLAAAILLPYMVNKLISLNKENPKQLSEAYARVLLSAGDNQIRAAADNAIDDLAKDPNYSKTVIARKTERNSALAKSLKQIQGAQEQINKVNSSMQSFEATEDEAEKTRLTQEMTQALEQYAEILVVVAGVKDNKIDIINKIVYLKTLLLRQANEIRKSAMEQRQMMQNMLQGMGDKEQEQLGMLFQLMQQQQEQAGQEVKARYRGVIKQKISELPENVRFLFENEIEEEKISEKEEAKEQEEPETPVITPELQEKLSAVQDALRSGDISAIKSSFGELNGLLPVRAQGVVNSALAVIEELPEDQADILKALLIDIAGLDEETMMGRYNSHYASVKKQVADVFKKGDSGIKEVMAKMLLVNKIIQEGEVKDKLAGKINKGLVKKGFVGLTEDGKAIISKELLNGKVEGKPTDQLYRTAIHESVHVLIAKLKEEKDARLEVLKNSIINSVNVQKFFDGLINAKDGYYGKYVQDDLWEEVVAYYIENMGTSPVRGNAVINELVIRVLLDKKTIELMNELGFYAIAPVIANDERFNKGIKNLGKVRKERGKDIKIVDLRKKVKACEEKMRPNIYELQRLQFNMEGKVIGEIPPAGERRNVLFVVDLPSCVEVKEGKPVLTKKGEFIRDRIRYVTRSVGDIQSQIGIAFVNIQKDGKVMPITDEIRNLFSDFGVRVGIVEQDVLVEAIKVQQKSVDLGSVITETAQKEVRLDMPQVVFVDSVNSWRDRIISIIVGITKDIVVQNAIEALVDPTNVRFAFAESLALATAIDSTARTRVLEKIKEMAKPIADKLGVEVDILIPKPIKGKDGQSLGYTVPPVPANVDELKQRIESTAVSA